MYINRSVEDAGPTKTFKDNFNPLEPEQIMSIICVDER
jgi:hypothetical protein